MQPAVESRRKTKYMSAVLHLQGLIPKPMAQSFQSDGVTLLLIECAVRHGNTIFFNNCDRARSTKRSWLE